MEIYEYLKEHRLIADGAFGTYFADRFNTQMIPEEANITAQDKVLEVHGEYLRAGARLIRTNTFAAYEANISPTLNVHEVRRAAVALATKAVQDYASDREIYIAGDIGPAPYHIFDEGSVKTYYEFAKDLISAGVRIILFETFPGMDGISDAIYQIKKDYPEVFVITNFAVNQYGYSTMGRSVKGLLNEAAAHPGVDAMGLNCQVGPAHMASLLANTAVKGEKYMAAFPNAGYPKMVRNRIIYSDNVEYFTEKVSINDMASILGGCCGTTPAHIRAMVEQIDQKKLPVVSSKEDVLQENNSISNLAFYAEKEKAAKGEKSKKLIAVELVPPFTADDAKIVEMSLQLKKMGVDVLTFPDSPSGRTRVDSVLMAKKVKDVSGLKVMPHISCRDKNAIALRSNLMGAYLNDIHNILVITGDPVPVSERGRAKAVFNFDSTGLMAMIDDINKEMFANSPIVFGGAINQNRRNQQFEIRRVHKKMEKGASFFLTMPAFTRKDADQLRFIKKETGAKMLVGIMPLVSMKNALFMKNEMPGLDVDDSIIDMFKNAQTREEGEAVAIQIATNSIERTKDFADGYYFSFPFNRVYLLDRLKSVLEDE